MSEIKNGKSIINEEGDIIGLEIVEYMTFAEVKKHFPDANINHLTN